MGKRVGSGRDQYLGRPLGEAGWSAMGGALRGEQQGRTWPVRQAGMQVPVTGAGVVAGADAKHSNPEKQGPADSTPWPR